MFVNSLFYTLFTRLSSVCAYITRAATREFRRENLTAVCRLCYNTRMKLSILVDIFFQILRERKLTASELCEKYGFSARTAYRYIEILAQTLPLQIKRGRNGGVRLADSYKLPAELLTGDEYTAAIQALTAAYSQTADERYLNAKRKLSAQNKADRRHAALVGGTSEILICDGENSALSQTLITLQECILERAVVLVRLKAEDKTAEESVEPHALIFDGKAWRLYAFFHDERAFKTLFIADMVGVFRTESTFRKRPFKPADVIKEI